MHGCQACPGRTGECRKLCAVSCNAGQDSRKKASGGCIFQRWSGSLCCPSFSKGGPTLSPMGSSFVGGYYELGVSWVYTTFWPAAAGGGRWGRWRGRWENVSSSPPRWAGWWETDDAILSAGQASRPVSAQSSNVASTVLDYDLVEVCKHAAAKLGIAWPVTPGNPAVKWDIYDRKRLPQESNCFLICRCASQRWTAHGINSFLIVCPSRATCLSMWVK